MSMTQTVLGGGIVLAVGTALIQAVAPAPAPITVHGLAFDSGFVLQDRTVHSDRPFYANWAAEVIDATTGETICEGNGAAVYSPGRSEVRLPLAKWVGEPCMLPPGSYRISASWYWGVDQVGAESAPFEVME